MRGEEAFSHLAASLLFNTKSHLRSDNPSNIQRLSALSSVSKYQQSLQLNQYSFLLDVIFIIELSAPL